MMKDHLSLLKFSLKLQSGWSALIALLLVLALEGTLFFWFGCSHAIFNIALLIVIDCNYFSCSPWIFKPRGSVILYIALFMVWAISYWPLFFISYLPIMSHASVTQGLPVSLTTNKGLRELQWQHLDLPWTKRLICCKRKKIK